MIRRLPALLAAVLAACALATPAVAHEPSILRDAAAAELDLGTVSAARLIHGTLETGTGQLRVTVTPAAGTAPVDALLLMPQREPERELRSAELPLLDVTGATAGSVEASDAELVDESTGLAYRVVARALLPADGATRTVVVRRGTEPVRIALWIGASSAPFATTEPRRLQSTLVRIRAWYETPAAGARTVRDGSAEASQAVERDAFAPWYAAGLALAALGVAAWWLRSGRTRARVRGMERQQRDLD